MYTVHGKLVGLYVGGELEDYVFITERDDPFRLAGTGGTFAFHGQLDHLQKWCSNMTERRGVEVTYYVHNITSQLPRFR